jgi:hypothetical protein
LNVEPNVLMPEGRVGGLEREGSAGDDFQRLQVGAAVVEAKLGRLTARGTLGGRDQHPLQDRREIAAVGVRVHLHGAADRPGDVHPELEAGQTGTRGLRRRLRQARATAADKALALLLDRRQVLVQLQH